MPDQEKIIRYRVVVSPPDADAVLKAQRAINDRLKQDAARQRAVPGQQPQPIAAQPAGAQATGGTQPEAAETGGGLGRATAPQKPPQPITSPLDRLSKHLQEISQKVYERTGAAAVPAGVRQITERLASTTRAASINIAQRVVQRPTIANAADSMALRIMQLGQTFGALRNAVQVSTAPLRQSLANLNNAFKLATTPISVGLQKAMPIVGYAASIGIAAVGRGAGTVGRGIGLVRRFLGGGGSDSGGGGDDGDEAGAAGGGRRRRANAPFGAIQRGVSHLIGGVVAGAGGNIGGAASGLMMGAGVMVGGPLAIFGGLAIAGAAFIKGLDTLTNSLARYNPIIYAQQRIFQVQTILFQRNLARAAQPLLETWLAFKMQMLDVFTKLLPVLQPIFRSLADLMSTLGHMLRTVLVGSLNGLAMAIDGVTSWLVKLGVVSSKQAEGAMNFAQEMRKAAMAISGPPAGTKVDPYSSSFLARQTVTPGVSPRTAIGGGPAYPGNPPIVPVAPTTQPTTQPTTLPAYARGGIITKPTIALIGEDGPEAVVPLKGLRQVMPRVGTLPMLADGGINEGFEEIHIGDKTVMVPKTPHLGARPTGEEYRQKAIAKLLPGFKTMAAAAEARHKAFVEKYGESPPIPRPAPFGSMANPSPGTTRAMRNANPFGSMDTPSPGTLRVLEAMRKAKSHPLIELKPQAYMGSRSMRITGGGAIEKPDLPPPPTGNPIADILGFGKWMMGKEKQFIREKIGLDKPPNVPPPPQPPEQKGVPQDIPPVRATPSDAGNLVGGVKVPKGTPTHFEKVIPPPPLLPQDPTTGDMGRSKRSPSGIDPNITPGVVNPLGGLVGKPPTTQPSGGSDERKSPWWKDNQPNRFTGLPALDKTDQTPTPAVKSPLSPPAKAEQPQPTTQPSTPMQGDRNQSNLRPGTNNNAGAGGTGSAYQDQRQRYLNRAGADGGHCNCNEMMLMRTIERAQEWVDRQDQGYEVPLEFTVFNVSAMIRGM